MISKLGKFGRFVLTQNTPLGTTSSINKPTSLKFFSRFQQYFRIHEINYHVITSSHVHRSIYDELSFMRSGEVCEILNQSFPVIYAYLMAWRPFSANHRTISVTSRWRREQTYQSRLAISPHSDNRPNELNYASYNCLGIRSMLSISNLVPKLINMSHYGLEGG